MAALASVVQAVQAVVLVLVLVLVLVQMVVVPQLGLEQLQQRQGWIHVQAVAVAPVQRLGLAPCRTVVMALGSPSDSSRRTRGEQMLYTPARVSGRVITDFLWISFCVLTMSSMGRRHSPFFVCGISADVEARTVGICGGVRRAAHM